MPSIIDIINNGVYAAQGLVAIWALFCAVMVWRRTSELNFRSMARQEEFLQELEAPIQSRKFEEVTEICEDDPRGLPQLTLLALENQSQSPAAVQQIIVDHWQRDVLSEMDLRMSWVTFAIKTLPMLGLLGTVMGMVGAFANMGSGDKVDPAKLASDISFALYTTAIGLAGAVPLMLISAMINIRMRKLEDRVTSGIARMIEMLKPYLGKTGERRS